MDRDAYYLAIEAYKKAIQHHGILGQKWGKRNGPPYPLKGGDYSETERKKIYKERNTKKNSIYNKKHFDITIQSGKDTLSTLSYDPNRTQGTDMFFAAFNKLDKHQYNSLFNRPIDKPVFDEQGNQIGTGSFLKYRINNNVKNDLKVASEDSAADIFADLYKNDRDFYNFVTDKSRMRKYFVDDKYKFKGYRQTRKELENVDAGKTPTKEQVQAMYRMFNYVIPYDGQGNAREAKDVLTQRTKFFKKCKEAGYGAILDTNDAIYGFFKAKAPVIVFDMEQIIPQSVKMTTKNEKLFSDAALFYRKLFKK